MRALVLGLALASCALCLALVRPAASGDVIVVKITDLAFSPAEVTAKVGDIVEWVNDDFIDHTVTADDESFDLFVAVGQSVRLELKRPGSIPYFCRIHPNMKGAVRIR
jgi:plastocyanin